MSQFFVRAMIGMGSFRLGIWYLVKDVALGIKYMVIMSDIKRVLSILYKPRLIFVQVFISHIH